MPRNPTGPCTLIHTPACLPPTYTLPIPIFHSEEAPERGHRIEDGEWGSPPELLNLGGEEGGVQNEI